MNQLTQGSAAQDTSTVIIDTGCANLSSVRYAFERLGVSPVISSDANVIKAAKRVVLPGVGSAKAAMASLQRKGLDTLIPGLTQPVLGVCLGMQLLCRQSSEGEQITPCLGIIDTDISQLDTGSKPLPHMGWNAISPTAHPLFNGMDSGEYVYFVHSFCARESQYTLARSDYGQVFSAAIGKDNFMGVQFHPEKSAAVGARILKNFMEMGE
ncbi:imidazole glycerol phosphate synthase subunit HisH [Shewanella submarina]|uniref:Imidazole glycerol phosphate synthase subunit HisH n=1 Tax=Shewanella submarina TaxID=2016376 RepID=A0ABV7GD75_9GAMM|nr:imidazole glycerol phosphate synthase subunit HisH [Shewanella submarina]MCL1039085.1 imidazole glycerol phosphate synthase subunit HisH [Shewanella submarina]